MIGDEDHSHCVDRMALDVIHERASPDPNVLEPPRRVQAGLPFDVLSQIFLSCLPDEGFPTLSAEEAPMVLGRVCSHWRDVALATHVLWAALNATSSFHFSAIWNPFDRRLALGIQEWIRRAGECALSYCLSFYSTTGQVIGVVDTILPHRRRWKHIEGHLPSDQWQDILSAIAEGTPLLEHLDISTDKGGTIAIQLSSTPLLQTLIVDPKNKVLGLDTCGKSLRSLTIRVADWNVCWVYLVHCPTLELLAVRSDIDDSTNDSLSTVVSDVGVLETRNLVDLSICLPSVGSLLDRLRSPALKTIKFESDDTDSKLLSFLERSRPPLEEFYVTARFSSNILLDCLRYTPALRSLGVHHRPKLTDADIKLLQLGPDSEKNICPGLQNIEFETCVEDAHMKPMEDMVLSRWKNRDVSHSMNSESASVQNCQWPRSLRSLQLGDCEFEEYSSFDSTYFESLPEIARCIEEGLEVLEVPPSDSD
ncbi:hypothetical protein BD410DRAFT_898657 [Rickenella mellea]|uniref:Uncharacterized protein n=1 Tax=Rickenella mellea TaxID=50990 RepID=A0A4Y7Q3G8_9AGAM|nr:hypothetical protein BD410DRAFT_898657 [Rickenella mellea]